LEEYKPALQSGMRGVTAQEIAERKRAADEAKKTNEELKKMNTKREGDTNVAVASQQQASTGKTTQEESPDEVENFGIVFMNKTTFGPGL